MYTNRNKWKILKKETIFSTKYQHVDKWLIRLPSGIEDDYYFHSSPDVVIVFALTKDKRVVVNDQLVVGRGVRWWQLPAGFIDQKETPLACIKRELLEETGFAAKDWKKLGVCYFGKWSVNKVHLFVAKGAYKVSEQILEESEDIKVKLVPIHKYMAQLRKGKIEDSSSLLCSLRAVDKLKIG